MPHIPHPPHLPQPSESKQKLAALTLGALGIVYGDIGTSPLYALRECFNPAHGVPPTSANVLGILSLIIWSLIIVVTIKYILFVMRADNEGEGGILALMALGQRHKKMPSSGYRLGTVAILGLIGASFLYGDGIITPAISVLSAVEGLELATPLLKPYVVMITVAILFGMFVVQKHGTGRIGAVFGPIMFVWFGTIGLLGLFSIMHAPGILQSMNPLHAFRFLSEHAAQGFLVLGSVFLALTGAEALYADMGHFGKRPIQLGWFAVAFPGLLLQYLGQGALLLRDSEAAVNPFYLLAPSWMLYPLVGLATAATVIASQAMLAGTFSISQQAVQLGYLPALQFKHTSAEQMGQIYPPMLNWTMLAGSIGLVLAFQSSSNLAAAYGIAVAGTMVTTTLIMYIVARHVWRWSVFLTVPVIAVFFVVDVSFFTANALKIPAGGWFPLVLGFLVFTLMTTWYRGRAIVAKYIKKQSPPLEAFLDDVVSKVPVKVPGHAVFMVQNPDVTPPALIQNIKHNKLVHKHIVFLTVITEKVPHIRRQDQITVTPMRQGVDRIVARCGFMDTADIPQMLRDCSKQGVDIPIAQTTFFLSRVTYLATARPGMQIWREKLFVFLSRNSQRASSFFRIPSDQVIEIGLVLEI